MKPTEQQLSESSRKLLNDDLQQREPAINAQLREAREQALLKVTQPASKQAQWGKRALQFGVPTAAFAVALSVAVPLLNTSVTPGGQTLQTAELAIEDPQLLEDLELALWFAEMQGDES